MTVRVRLLGRPHVGDGQPARQPRGHKSWALLARVALSERPLSRRDLADELFLDADDPLGALRWSLSDLRRALACPDTLRGDPIRFARDEVRLDVWDLEAGSLDAADLGGPLLDGLELRNCPGFDTWLLLARARCAARTMEELRRHTLNLLAAGEAEAAIDVAGCAARLEPLDGDAQELFLRALVAGGRASQASLHLAACVSTFTREGLSVSPSMRDAARAPGQDATSGLRAGVVARSLLQAGSAALAAGAADAGVETLRRAAEQAEGARDAALSAQVLAALGSALVHAVRGADGEGAVALHRALRAARTARTPAVASEVLRELAFVDVMAGRHASAAGSLRAAAEHARAVGDEGLMAGVLAIQGMNAADRGRHLAAVALFTESARLAATCDRPRQQAWSLGVMSRSLLLSGQVRRAQQAAEASIDLTERERWNAYLPWPQAIRAEVLLGLGDRRHAREEAERSFALGCELADPCWEGMAGRALGLVALHVGDVAGARAWVADARQRCDRVQDRYVWVSARIGLTELELAVRAGDDAGALAAAARLGAEAARWDLPEFLAWALVHQAETGDRSRAPLARAAAEGVVNPALQARVMALPAR